MWCISPAAWRRSAIAAVALMRRSSHAGRAGTMSRGPVAQWIEQRVYGRRSGYAVLSELQFGGGRWPGDVVALGEVPAEVGEGVQGGALLASLGDDLEAESVGEADCRLDERTIVWLLIERCQEAP